MFKTTEEVESYIRTPSSLVIPVKKAHNGQVQFALQLEADLSQEQPDLKKTRKKLPLHLSKGWNYNDQNMVSIILEFFSMKLDILLLNNQMSEKDDKVQEIIGFAQDIARRKTYRHLIRGIKSNVCRIFGFSEVGILFYDEKSIFLFITL